MYISALVSSPDFSMDAAWIGSSVMSGDYEGAAYGAVGLAIPGVLAAEAGPAGKLLRKGLGEKIGTKVDDLLRGSKSVSYVRESLPKLTGKPASSFEGETVAVTLKPGDKLYRVQEKGLDIPTGQYFGDIKPVNAKEADELYNIRSVSDNPMKSVSDFEVTQPVTLYYSPVKGGTGMQYYMPVDVDMPKVLKKTGETVWE